MKSPTETEQDMKIFTLTIIATDMCGEYFDGEPFAIGQRQRLRFQDIRAAWRAQDFFISVGFDTLDPVEAA